MLDPRRRVLFVIATATLLPPCLAARAQPTAPGGGASAAAVTVSTPWTRAAGQGGTGAGFMTLRNAGTMPDRVLSAASPVARRVELHTHIREGDVMRMREVPAIDLPSGQEVRLAPGGLHVMLIGLARALRQGERVPLTLTLERSGTIAVELEVLAAGARGPAAGHSGGGH